MVTPSDISVVVQGPIASGDAEIPTAEALRSVRQHLPGAELILSTWEGISTSGLDYDKLILSQDPGAPKLPDGRFYNLNRMLVGTRTGLLAATRPMAVKMRSDSRLEHANFLSLSRTAPPRSPLNHYFSERVLGCDLYFRNPAKLASLHLFHPTDIFHFGLTKDLTSLWSRPLLGDMPDIKFWEGWEYTPEQYVWITYLRQVHGVKVEWRNAYDYSVHQAVLSEISLMNNFAIYSCEQIGLRLTRKLSNMDPVSIYTHAEWLELAQKCHRPWLITWRMMRISAKRSWWICVKLALQFQRNQIRSLRNLARYFTIHEMLNQVKKLKIVFDNIRLGR
jgi:hypothetical protein